MNSLDFKQASQIILDMANILSEEEKTFEEVRKEFIESSTSSNNKYDYFEDALREIGEIV